MILTDGKSLPMTLPVSSYEELLARVRSLTSETIQLRREITMSLCDHSSVQVPLYIEGQNINPNYTTYPQKRLSLTDELVSFSKLIFQ